jgi:hypothetical protein
MRMLPKRVLMVVGSKSKRIGADRFTFIQPMEVDALPYDDEAGEKFAQEHPELDFKSRIGSGRLYLLSESSAAMNGRSRVRLASNHHKP